MRAFGKFVGAVALLAVGAVGLAMSLCGGVFTFEGLMAQGVSSILAISVPSLVAGISVVWFVTRRFLNQVVAPPDS